MYALMDQMPAYMKHIFNCVWWKELPHFNEKLSTPTSGMDTRFIDAMDPCNSSFSIRLCWPNRGHHKIKSNKKQAQSFLFISHLTLGFFPCIQSWIYVFCGYLNGISVVKTGVIWNIILGNTFIFNTEAQFSTIVISLHLICPYFHTMSL